MLGNWLLQNGGDFAEAVSHFQTAVATGKARPLVLALVRTMQIGGLISSGSGPGRAELLRAANDMRKNNETLDEHSKSRILFECFGPSFNDRARLVESLSVLPPGDAWPTYLWLDDRTQAGDEAKSQLLAREFVQANLLEISGKRPEALARYVALRQELKNQHSSLQSPVDQAIARLSQSH